MTNTTSQYSLGVAQYRSGSIMCVTQDDGDITTLNAMSTSNKLIKINIHLFCYCDINIIYLLLSVSSSFPSNSSFILK